MPSFSLSLSVPAEHVAFLSKEASGKSISVQQLIRNIIVNYIIMKEERDEPEA